MKQLNLFNEVRHVEYELLIGKERIPQHAYEISSLFEATLKYPPIVGSIIFYKGKQIFSDSPWPHPNADIGDLICPTGRRGELGSGTIGLVNYNTGRMNFYNPEHMDCYISCNY